MDGFRLLLLRQERINWTACEAQGGREEQFKTACEAPGRQERINWTVSEAPERHQGGRKGFNWTACKAPGRQERINWTARDQGGTREASRERAPDFESARFAVNPGVGSTAGLDSLREAPGRQERTIWTA